MSERANNPRAWIGMHGRPARARTRTAARVRGAAGAVASVMGAFTLLEMLVAIGAVAVIAVGLAAVFDAVGKTVGGGRRASLLSNYATVLETQMRRDLGNLTRDGFMMIRHQVASGERADGAGGQIDVELFRDDPSPHKRRIDEIMFFALGEYRSLREPLVRGMEAASRQARIYYGHGIRLPESSELAYTWPAADDNYAQRLNEDIWTLGEQPDGETNPNRYAADWVLLRQVSLLAQPETTRVSIPSTALGIDATQLQNSEYQIGGQPAMTSVFRRVAELMRLPASTAVPYVRKSASASAAPRERLGPHVQSGLVDIITTDLGEIRQFVTTFNRFPNQLSAADLGVGRIRQYLDGQVRAQLTDVPLMQAWMSEGWPTNSVASSRSGPRDARGLRIRYEPTPPDMRNVLEVGNDFDAAVRRADQLMLSASAFVPNCSEFMVEWSFGQQYPATDVRKGRTIWYGERANTGPLTDEYQFTQYDSNNNEQAFRPFAERGQGAITNHLLRKELVYDQATRSSDTDAQTAYFGYLDPTYVPFDEDQPDSVVWAWPKQLRITVGLSDPQNPSIEQKFQFVLEIPGQNTP